MTDRLSDHSADLLGSSATWLTVAERIQCCARRMRERLGRHAAHGTLTDTEVLVLWCCASAPPPGIAQSELVDRLAISPAQASGLVERLRQTGMLEGMRAAHDRRRQVWRLSPRGAAVLQDALRQIGPWAETLSADLGERDVAQLLSILDRLTELLGRDSETGASRPAEAFTGVQDTYTPPQRGAA